MKKGHTALEYLITYGWAILVILVVLAVLWYYGIFDPSKWAGEQPPQFTNFVVGQGEYKLTNTQLQLNVKSKLSKEINITSVVITRAGAEVNDTSNINTVGHLTDVIIGPNGEGNIDIGLNDLGVNVGDPVTLGLTVNYQIIGGFAKSDSSTMIVNVES